MVCSIRSRCDGRSAIVVHDLIVAIEQQSTPTFIFITKRVECKPFKPFTHCTHPSTL